MIKVAIAACRTNPALSASNSTLAGALQDEGFEVNILRWNGATLGDFLDNDIVLLRQTWDYQDDPGGFAAWVTRLSSLGCNIQNAPDLSVWNNDKRTLREFTDAGVHVPESCEIDSTKPDQCFEYLGTDKIVLKPAFGGSGIGVRLCRAYNLSKELSAVHKEALGRQVFAQEFLPEIADGEWKMTCIDGSVAFAVHSVPRQGEFRINARFNPRITVSDPPASAVKAAGSIMSWIGRPMLSCRVNWVSNLD